MESDSQLAALNPTLIRSTNYPMAAVSICNIMLLTFVMPNCPLSFLAIEVRCWLNNLSPFFFFFFIKKRKYPPLLCYSYQLPFYPSHQGCLSPVTRHLRSIQHRSGLSLQFSPPLLLPPPPPTVVSPCLVLLFLRYRFSRSRYFIVFL